MIKIRGREAWSSRGVAVILNLGRNTMLKALRSKGIFSRANLPRSTYCGLGYFVVESTKFASVTYFTREGIEFVKEALKDLPRTKEKSYRCEELPPGLCDDD